MNATATPTRPAEHVHTHFSRLAEQGVWASLYDNSSPKVTVETWSFLIRARRVIELLRTVGTGPGDVLDLGCGTAPIARSLVAMGGHYTGTDFSPQMIDAARANIGDLVIGGNADLQVGLATTPDFADASFDTIIAMGVLEYLTRDQLTQTLRGVSRMLRPGGVALLTIPKRRNWGRLVLAGLYPLRKAIQFRPYRKNLKLEQQEEFRRLYLTPGELDQACEAAGMEKADARHYNVQPACRPATLVAPRLCHLVNRPFEGLARVPGANFLATGYIGMYRKAN
ncbi:class I SAM-dependent methyltransferase [Zavarzinella formosa]|uniref:class I SAM-dependent methyltransferase n=1 Tax=Zavarzinella formosa TaxID=360055 RepID=UPI0002DF3443|nr:class I SAM-dependent methyltransferase [Zavarzinella formosa]